MQSSIRTKLSWKFRQKVHLRHQHEESNPMCRKQAKQKLEMGMALNYVSLSLEIFSQISLREICKYVL